jgi:hypothetical protein
MNNGRAQKLSCFMIRVWGWRFLERLQESSDAGGLLCTAPDLNAEEW